MPELKLSIELVPSSLWQLNPRTAMGKAAWDRLRKEVYAEYNHVCGICGAQSRLSCHERWAYDDEAHVQKLMGFIALCDWCHHIKHLGLAGILAGRGELDYERVIQHFCEVNQCTKEEFEHQRNLAFVQWYERNRCPWTADWGAYAYLMRGEK